MDKAVFVGTHYAAVSLFVFACWGVGNSVLRRLLDATPMSVWLATGLSACCGIGIAICFVQLLAIAGLLVTPALLTLLGVGVVIALWQVQRLHRMRTIAPAASRSRAPMHLHWTVWLLLLLGFGTVLFPLRPPYMWDELMYHLPHAQEWARTGRLQVNEWLRYPWAPFNYQLLYAAALVLSDDLMPHLLHALAGWLVALLLYQLTLRYAGHVVAFVATVAWLAIARHDFGNAYVELASALFVLAGWIGFMFWWNAAPQRWGGWLLPAAFFLGVAAGVKYQTLGLLPFFAAAVLLGERRPRPLLLALAAGLLPCIYWYGRNALLTGNPFEPLGSSLFGFQNWNADDMQRQLLDLSTSSNWPPLLVWPAIAAPLLPSIGRNPPLRMAALFSGYAVIVWLVTSHFARYLLPLYPLLLMLAACVVCRAAYLLVTRVAQPGRTGGVRVAFGQAAKARLQNVLIIALVALSVHTTARSLSNDWLQVASTPAQREAFLARQLWEYWGTTRFLHSLPQARIYQNGMEGAIYYAPHPIWGDQFGPWRYSDFVALDPIALAHKLDSLDLDTLVLRFEFNQNLRDNPQFPRCFERLRGDDTFGVYRVKHWQQPGGGHRTCQPVKIYRFVIGPSSADSP